MASVLAIGSLYIKRHMMPLTVEFQHLEPADIAHYFEIFGAPVTFSSSSNRLILSKSLLKVFGVVYHTVSFQVRADISRLLGETAPGRNEVAALLSTSERTLQRRLEQEGTTYKELLDDVRRERVIEILKSSPNLNLPAVASQVGFTDAATLTRAFRRWTGMTPGNWRRHYS